MLAPERHQQIITLLEQRGTIRTIDLAEEFQVTDETIRRDLQILAKDGQLTRVHGGASTLSGRPALQSFTERSNLNTEAKHAIASAALQFIQPGKTYAFDSSTTANALVSILPEQPLRIVTNAYSVINRLAQFENIELISTGGRFHPKTQTFIGGESVESLRRHNVNKAFISCIGIDPARGVSEGFEQQAIFKEQLVSHAEQTVLLADSSKFNLRADYFFARLNQIDCIITDSAIDTKIASQFRDLGCQVNIAD
ncbi:MAG: DeoR/GlpR family DNA-binding transcription regulator [Lentimonas sp.]